jgi:uncharacterized repeat protein (TIGR04138 family)
MTLAENSTLRRLRFHPNAYLFVSKALRFTQELLDRVPPDSDSVPDPEAQSEDAHISGSELLEGVRRYAQEQYGCLAKTVFNQWGLTKTEDFGRIVFELVERGEMCKTDNDQIDDFVDVYEFEDGLLRDYRIDTSKVFDR